MSQPVIPPELRERPRSPINSTLGVMSTVSSNAPQLQSMPEANDVATSVRIPRKALVVPGLVVFVIVAAMWVAERLGTVWNIHGSGILVFGLLALSGASALLTECVLIPLSIVRLSKHPELRSMSNICSVGFAAAFVIFVALWLVVSIARGS